MPVPILKIPIDDAAFQRYLATFQKYQEQVKAQPEMWKGLNTSFESLTVAGAAVAAEIAHQAEETRKLATEEAKREEAQKKADKEKRDRDKEEADREKDAATRRKKAIADVREYSRGLADAAINLGKWALIGEGASLAAGALGLWGLDKLVGGVGDQRRAAQGLNVSMGQQQGANLFLQRYFEVNSALANVATAQETPAQWGVFRMMGIDPQGKDPAQLTNEAALSARRMFINDRENLALAGAQGLTQIFSPEDLRRLAATPEGELKASIAQSDKFAGDIGLRDDVGRKWQDFMVNLDHAGLKIKNTLIDKLTLLERNGDLDKIVQKFGDLAVNVLDRIDFQKLGDGLDVFTKYITGDKFQADFQLFITDIGLVAKKTADALVYLGLIPSAAASAQAPAGMQSAAPYEKPGLFNGYSGSLPGSHTPARNYIGNQLEKWGWTPNQAKGLLANLGSESGLNPFAKGDRGAAYGLGQWHTDRQAQYAQLFGHSMQSVKDPQQALREQLEFVQWELGHTFKKAGDDLRRSRGAYAAGYTVSREYERPRGAAITAALRGTIATVVEIKNQTGSSVAVTANAAAGG